MYKFSKSHEWVKVEGDFATIGISDYAQSELGDIVFVELPEVGDKFVQGEVLGTVESTKAASEIYCPLSGEIIEVNEELPGNPQWINKDALGRGWLVKIRIDDYQQINQLLDEASYSEYVKQESR